MSRTANDYKMSGGFLPVFDEAAKPNLYPLWAPEDDHPWTAEDETKLKRVVEQYHHLPAEQLNWVTISLKCAFGHNSGSCKAKFESLPKHKYADMDRFSFTPGGGVAASKAMWS